MKSEFSPRLTSFLKTYQEIEQNLDRAISEMEGRNRRRIEFEAPYNAARDALLDIHLKIGNKELPEVYSYLIKALDGKMLTARNKRNAIIQLGQGRKLTAGIPNLLSDKRIYSGGLPN